MRKKTKSNSTSSSKRSRVVAWIAALTRRTVVAGFYFVVIVGAAIVGVYGTRRLEASVEDRVRERYLPRITLLDLPPELAESTRRELQERVAPLLDRAWTEPDLPRKMADALRESGWVERVLFVRRTGNGHFLISCRYRTPVAMIQQGVEYYLLDREGVRLPGRYVQDSSWKVVSGVSASAPAPGAPWVGDDLRAGLAVIERVVGEDFAEQIVGVSVENFAGRRNRWKSHIELITDGPHGRIRWGSAPGQELEENAFAQKLAILRENFRQTGRVDAHYPVIDVSTFPDQFTIPG